MRGQEFGWNVWHITELYRPYCYMYCFFCLIDELCMTGHLWRGACASLCIALRCPRDEWHGKSSCMLGYTAEYGYVALVSGPSSTEAGVSVSG
jgi:hypothetical protein